MIITLEKQCTTDQRAAIEAVARGAKLEVHPIIGVNETVLGLVGDFNGRYGDMFDHFQAMPGVASIQKISKPYKLAGRDMHPADTIVEVGGVKIGDGSLTHIAGPCAVESEVQIRSIALLVHDAGANVFRGGAFKPRTSPYSFSGLKEDGLRMLRDAGGEVGMPVVTEVMDTRDVPVVSRYADILQVGARNMKNFSLLQEVGQTGMPVMLKRGADATIEDLLMSAEHVLSRRRDREPRLILCERGVIGFDDETRNLTDMSAIPVLHRITHLPVVLDPSHATGVREYVGPMALAGVAAGADGIHIEVHNKPEEALCDGKQSLLPDQYAELIERMAAVHRAVRGVYPRG